MAEFSEFSGGMQGRYLTETPPQKRRNTAHAFGISDLPDEILILIFSFLRTKEVVQTSLLAKRFKNLWASASVLNFDLHEFIPDGTSLEDLQENEEYLREYEEMFSKFVDGVLKHRNSVTLDSFKVIWNVAESNPTPATSWLDTVAKLKPKSVSIHIFSENYLFEVPDSVFTCESLQQLILHLGYETINPRYVNFPCLKTLIVDCILIEDVVMQKLSGLPALEEMVLRNCGFEFSDISSQTLKRLVLDRYHNDFGPPDISISIPNLLHLEVHSWVMGKLKFKNLESLVNARIHYNDFDTEGPLSLMGLSNVTYLELMLDEWCLLRMKNTPWIGMETTKIPTFNNLKTLKVGERCMTDGFNFVAHFLLHAPSVEKLLLLYEQTADIHLELLNEISAIGEGSNLDDYVVCKKRARANWL